MLDGQYFVHIVDGEVGIVHLEKKLTKKRANYKGVLVKFDTEKNTVFEEKEVMYTRRRLKNDSSFLRNEVKNGI